MVVMRTYLPSAELSHFVSRYHVVSGQQADEAEQFDMALYDRPFLRIARLGTWAAEVGGTDQWTELPAMTFAGSVSRRVPLRVRGPFHLFGVAFRPAGWKALFDRPASDFTDNILPFREVWGSGADRLQDAVLRFGSERDIIRAFEDEAFRQLDRIGTWRISAAMGEFERIARADCTRQVKDVAAQLHLSPRQFERLSLNCFGLSPKLVLRISRFLNMASAMVGLGDQHDEELAELRFFDQSHRNREFRQFIGMTPQQFLQTPLPLFRASLNARHLRKSTLSHI
jgi:AraC-like DNA-binding protein